MEFQSTYRTVVRFRPLGEEYLVDLTERPEKGEPLVGLFLDDGWIAVEVRHPDGELDFEYVIAARASA